MPATAASPLHTTSNEAALGIAGGAARDYQAILGLPLSKMRIEFMLFRGLYNQWMEGSPRQSEDLQKALIELGLDPRMRDFDYWLDSIASELPVGASGDEFRRLFQAEVAKVRFAIEHGTTENCPAGAPAPNDRWRRTLWGVGMLFAEMKATLAQPHPSKEEVAAAVQAGQQVKIPPIADIKPIQDALAETVAMQRALDEFVKRTNLSQRGIGDSAKGVPPATVQYGPMRSWFYNAQKKHDPDLENDLINLDLQISLILGDFVDAVFQHEQEHQEKSVVYPESLDKHRRLAKEAEEKLEQMHQDGVGIKVGKEGIKNFDQGSEAEKLVRQKMLHNYIFALMQPVWNCAEDNMCDQGVANLSIPDRKDPLYPFDMAHAINTVTALIRGPGSRLIGIEPKPAQPKNDKEKNELELHKIQMAILLAFYLRNKLVPDNETGRGLLGIDLSVIKDAKYPELDGEAAYGEMRKLCDAIANAQPIPNDRKAMGLAEYARYCATTCNERNLLIDELFERFVQATLDKMIEEFENKDLDQQIQDLKDQLKKRSQQQKGGQPGQQGQGGGQGEGEGEGQGEGKGDIPVEMEDQEPNEGEGKQEGEGKDGKDKDGKGKEGKGKNDGIPKDEQLGDKPGQHHGKKPSQDKKQGSGSKNWGDATRDAEKKKPDLDGKSKGEGEGEGEGKERRQMRERSGTPGGGGVGQGGDPLKELNLGDGRSWEELRKDPKYQEAVDYVAEKLRAISERFPTVVIRREEVGSLSPTQAANMGDLTSRADRGAIFDMEAALATGDDPLSKMRATFRDDIEEKIASPGDLFLAIDASGSMGSGAGSRLEAAVKSAAILYDAAKQVGFGVYVSVWGNDFPYLLTAPGIDDTVTIGQFDTILRAAMRGGHVSGLHLGTNLDGAVANMFAQLAQYRDESSLYENDEATSDLSKRQRPRGPVHALFLTDGEVGSQAEQIDRALEGKTAMTIDAALTEGSSQSMREIMARVPNLDRKRSIIVDISDTKTIPQQMVAWAEQRYQSVLDHVQSLNGEWPLTQEKLEAEMHEASEQYCHDHKSGLLNHGHDAFMANAKEQLDRLSAPPSTQVSGGSARLSAHTLAAPPEQKKIA